MYVGPSRLLVNLWVRPAEAARDDALVERVDRLRADLLADDAIAEVTVTVTER